MTIKNRYIVIVGCGRLGTQLANLLSRAGNSVVVVDSDENSFSKLSSDFSGFRIDGDATSQAVLLEAKVQKADILIATTSSDNINLMVAQVARKVYGVPHVLARVAAPTRMELSARIDISTICPTQMAAEMFLQDIKTRLAAKTEV